MMKHPYACPYCGASAPKLTTTVWIRRAGDGSTDSSYQRFIRPESPLRTIADCRRHSNQEVVRVSYWGEGDRRHVTSFHEWDGETYWHRKEPFCSLKCALAFARAAHKAGYRMVEVGKVEAA